MYMNYVQSLSCSSSSSSNSQSVYRWVDLLTASVTCYRSRATPPTAVVINDKTTGHQLLYQPTKTRNKTTTYAALIHKWSVELIEPEKQNGRLVSHHRFQVGKKRKKTRTTKSARLSIVLLPKRKSHTVHTVFCYFLFFVSSSFFFWLKCVFVQDSFDLKTFQREMRYRCDVKALYKRGGSLLCSSSILILKCI